MTIRNYRGAASERRVAITVTALLDRVPLTSVNVNLCRMVILRGMSRLLVVIVLLLATAFSGTANASLRTMAPATHAVLCANCAVAAVAIGVGGKLIQWGAPERRSPGESLGGDPT